VRCCGREQNILRLEVAVDDTRLLHDAQGLEDLGGEVPDEGEWEAAELILFQQLVQIHVQELKDEAQMPLVRERVQESDQVLVIFRIVLVVQQSQHSHLGLGLPQIRRLVLHDLDRHRRPAPDRSTPPSPVWGLFLTLENLSESALAQQI
jgi:hypothetical protein